MAEKKSFLTFWIRCPLSTFVVRALRLRQLAGWLLRLAPRERTLPESGARYRCRYLETILLADELFHRNVYLKAIDSAGVKTFVDLGCNVGLFPVLLTEMTGRRDLQGLLIDADPEMIQEAAWHVKANKLDQVIPVFGLAGAAHAGQPSIFICCLPISALPSFPFMSRANPRKGPGKKFPSPVWMSKPFGGSISAMSGATS